LAFTRDGHRLAAVSQWDSTLCVWDVESGTAFGTDLPGHIKPPNTLRFFNDDQRLASAGDDGTMVCCFDLKKSRNDCRISALVMYL
jgi:WD40 repeat protein